MLVHAQAAGSRLRPDLILLIFRYASTNPKIGRPVGRVTAPSRMDEAVYQLGGEWKATSSPQLGHRRLPFGLGDRPVELASASAMGSALAADRAAEEFFPAFTQALKQCVVEIGEPFAGNDALAHGNQECFALDRTRVRSCPLYESESFLHGSRFFFGPSVILMGA